MANDFSTALTGTQPSPDSLEVILQGLKAPPRNRLEQLLQSLSPGRAVYGATRDAAHAVEGVYKNLAGPPVGAPAPIGPGPGTEDTLRTILTGLAPQVAQGQELVMPGFVAPGNSFSLLGLPAPPTLQGPDFSGMNQALDAAKPRQTAFRSPEEEASYVHDTGLQGMAEGAAANAAGSIGDVLLGLGAGRLGGEAKGRRDIVDRRDDLEKANTEYQLKLAGARGDQARVMADVAMDNAKLQYNYALEKARLAAETVQKYKPEIKIGENNVVVSSIGPDGNVHIRTMPLYNSTFKGLGGGSIHLDISDLNAAWNDPVKATGIMIDLLDERGQTGTLFGDTLQELEKEVQQKMPASFQATGATGEKMWAARFQAERRWRLSEALLNEPALLNNAARLLQARLSEAAAEE